MAAPIGTPGKPLRHAVLDVKHCRPFRGVVKRVSRTQPCAADGKAQRVALRGQLEDQFLLVIGQVILDAGHFGELQQRLLQRFRGGFQILERQTRD